MDDKPRAPRHRPEAGYAKGDETRRRIIDAAIRLFGERGYDGTSTRAIAEAAGVNAPALQYYFDGKEGVYRACAEHIADSATEHFAPVMARAQALLDAPRASRETLKDMVEEILDALAEHLLVSEEAQQRQLFVAHEQVGHGPSLLFQLLDEDLRPRMGEMTVRLMARITGRPERDALNAVRVMSLVGQVLVFHTKQRNFVARMGWERMGAEQVALIKDAVKAQSRVLMDSWTPAARKKAGVAKR